MTQQFKFRRLTSFHEAVQMITFTVKTYYYVYLNSSQGSIDKLALYFFFSFDLVLGFFLFLLIRKMNDSSF